MCVDRILEEVCHQSRHLLWVDHLHSLHPPPSAHLGLRLSLPFLLLPGPTAHRNNRLRRNDRGDPTVVLHLPASRREVLCHLHDHNGSDRKHTGNIPGRGLGPFRLPFGESKILARYGYQGNLLYLLWLNISMIWRYSCWIRKFSLVTETLVRENKRRGGEIYYSVLKEKAQPIGGK